MENKFEFDEEPTLENNEIEEKHGDAIAESEERGVRRDKRKQPPMPMHAAGLRGRPPKPLSGKVRKRIKETQE